MSRTWHTLWLLAWILTPGCNFRVAAFSGGGGGDMSVAPDLAGPCSAGSVSCDGDLLVTCRADGSGADATSCALGCAAGPPAHCNAFYPRPPISRADFDAAGLTPQTWSVGPALDTEHGCVGCGANPMRPNNSDPNSYEVHNGIGFRVASIPGAGKLGVWTFASLSVAAGSTVEIFGANGAALVAAGDLKLDGRIDATCAANLYVTGGAVPNIAGPGGFAGAASDGSVKGGGSGGGSSADSAHGAGGGGAGYADVGGAGGDQGTDRGGGGGAAVGGPTLSPLVGGAGGGAGGENGGNAAPGGGGGGIVVLVALGTITVGAGAAVGGINAGGCGGSAQLGTTLAGVGGGGGGAGGAIWLQAPLVHLAPLGVLAANGGGGAAGGALAGTLGANGQAGQLGAGAATGGNALAPNGSGGPGAAGDRAMGGGGGSATSSGGGGGGAVGRIRIETLAGKGTLDSGAVSSPSAAQGTIDVH